MSTIANRVLIAGTALLLGMTADAQSARAAGHWTGNIQIPNHALSISVDIAQKSAGTWIGSMSMLSSTSTNVPLTNIVVSDTSVRFTATLPGKTSFEGRLSTDAAAISGTVSSLEGRAPFELARRGDANVSVPPPSSALPKEFEGRWEGTLEKDGRSVPVAVVLSTGADGLASATLYVIAQSVDLPVTTVAIKERAVQLEVRAISGVYRGTVGTLGAADTITGEWTEGLSHTPLTLTRRAATSPR